MLIVKKIVIWAVAACAVTALFVWALLAASPLAGVRAGIAEKFISTQLGADVEISGDLRILLGGTTGIVAEGIELPNPSASDQPLASLGSLSLNLALMPALKGDLILSDIAVDGLSADLPNGPASIAALRDAFPQPSKPKAKGKGKAPTMTDGQITLTNTRLTFQDAKSGLDLTLVLDNSTLQTTLEDKSLKLDGTGTLNDEAFTLSAAHGPDDPFNAALTFSDMNITADLTPAASEDAPNSIALVADVTRLSQLLDALKMQKPVDGTARVSATLKLGPDANRLDDLDVNVAFDGGQSIVVFGNVGVLGSKDDVSLTTRIRLYPEDNEPPATKSRRDLQLIAVDMVIDSVPGQIAQRSMKIVTNGFTIDTQGEGPPPITVSGLARSPEGKLILGNVNLRIGQPESPFLILDGAVNDALRLAEIDATGTLDLTTATLLSPMVFQDSDHLGRLTGGFKLQGDAQELALSDLQTTTKDTDLWTLSVAGSVKNVMRFQDVALNIDVDVPSSKDLLAAMTLKPLEIEPVKLSMDLTSHGDEWDAEAAVRIAESNLALKLDLDNATADPVVKGLIESDMIQIEHLRHIFDVVLQLQNLIPKDDAAPQQDEAEPGIYSNVTLIPIGQAALVSGMNADVVIDLRKVEGAKGLSSLHSELQLNEKELTAGPIEFQYDTVKVDMTGRIDLTQDEHVLELKGSTGGWRLHEILELIKFKKSASGTLYSSFDINGPVKSAQEFLSGMNGSVTISMKNGKIETQLLDLAGLGVLPWLFTKHKDKHAPISCLRAPLSISNGTISTRRTAIETNQVQIVVYGDVDLPGKTIDIHGQPRKIGEPLSRSPWPFSLSGALNKPKVKVKDGPKKLKRKDGKDQMPAKRKACVPDILQLQ